MAPVFPLQAFLALAKEKPQTPYLHQPIDGSWTTYSYADVELHARKLASALLAQGYGRGDRIAILAKNSAEWIITDLAIMMAGMISVPIYATAGSETIDYVLKHSEAKALFFGNLDSVDAVSNITALLTKISFSNSTVAGDYQLQDWIVEYPALEEVAEYSADDILTIIYTSGSTGVPKGVVLTHKNMAAGAQNASGLLGDGETRMLSYLPMAHVTERSVVSMNSFYNRIEVFFNESQQTFVRDLKHARVTVFISVPRLWFKFRSQVLAAIPENQLQALLKSNKGSAVVEQILDQLGFAHCQIFASGTAPIAKELLAWFAELNININEAWGMTEVAGVGCANSVYRPEDVGTVGRPVKGLELKLSAEQEVLVRGEATFKSYYRNPEATNESFDDGWFKTGDMGEITSSEAVKIIGRVKEQFKSAKGKYVSPVPIESKLSACNLVEQVCVVGSGMPQPLALIVLSEGIEQSDSGVDAELDSLISAVNQQLEGHEKLDALLIVEDDWTIESGLLTPTLKLKRNAIEDRYQVLWQNAQLSGVCRQGTLLKAE